MASITRQTVRSQRTIPIVAAACAAVAIAVLLAGRCDQRTPQDVARDFASAVAGGDARTLLGCITAQEREAGEVTESTLDCFLSTLIVPSMGGASDVRMISEVPSRQMVDYVYNVYTPDGRELPLYFTVAQTSDGPRVTHAISSIVRFVAAAEMEGKNLTLSSLERRSFLANTLQSWTGKLQGCGLQGWYEVNEAGEFRLVTWPEVIAGLRKTRP